MATTKELWMEWKKHESVMMIHQNVVHMAWNRITEIKKGMREVLISSLQGGHDLKTAQMFADEMYAEELESKTKEKDEAKKLADIAGAKYSDAYSLWYMRDAEDFKNAEEARAIAKSKPNETKKTWWRTIRSWLP